MKYWLLTTAYTSDQESEIKTYINEHAKIFSANGHNVLIIQGGEGNADEVINISNNVTLHKFSLKGKNSTGFMGYQGALSFEFANEVIKLLANDTPDVIEIQEYLGIGYYLLIRKYAGEPLLKNIPVIVTAHMPSFILHEHDHIATYRFPQYWTGEMEKFSMLAADAFISPSKYLAQLLRNHMPEAFPAHVHHIPYPLSLTNTLASAKADKKTFLVLGKMSYARGVLKLLNAANQLWKKGVDFEIKWVGNGDDFITTEEQTVSSFIRNKYSAPINAGKLHLVDNAKPNELHSHLSAAHAVIVPSITDNLPYAVIQAMTAGKVVLASANGGQAELIEDGTTGFIFDWEQPGSFEEKLNQVLSLTDEEAAKIGKKAIEAVTVCSAENYYTLKYTTVTDVIKSYTPKTNFPVLRPQPRQESKKNSTLQEGLTVAIPYYNMGEFIDECLASIFASSYKNLKVIIVDDGSTDNASVLKLNDIERNYPDITIIHQNNAGLSEARNSGLKIANTKYIQFLDADDTVHTDYFQRCIDIMDSYDNISFVSCWLKYFGAEEGTWPGQNPEVPYLLFHNTVHSGCLFKTKDILQTGGYDKSLVYGMEDYEMAIHLVSKGFHGFTIPEALYNYRIRKQSMARGFTDDKKLYLYALISKKHKALFDKYGAESVNILNANGPGFLHDNPTFASRFITKTIAPKSIRRILAEAIFNKYPKVHKAAIYIKGLLKR